ncbi:MAG TPA: alpha/beta fold hydrolase [Vicinamibacterales bacterium]
MRFHCTALAAAALLAAAGTASAQAPSPAPGEAVFGIFVKGTQIGREQVTLARTSSGWVITSTGQTGAPVDFTVTRFEMKYAADWQPLEMKLEARLKNVSITLASSFAMTTAINEITQSGKTVAKEDQISARTIVLPNNVFGSYEALAVRLSGVTAGAEFPVYVAPQTEVKVAVRAVSEQTLTRPEGALPTRRFELSFQNPNAPLDAIAVIDETLRLVRFEIPAVGLLVVREDASSVATRAQTVRNATDADVSIPANGFNLAGTLTAPPGVAGRLRHPAIILVGGSTPGDRDEVLDGIPVFAQLAKALADTGALIVRYDRRGGGQSGGRTETATLPDFADDVSAVVKWLSHRDDVDKRRIVVAGRGDGGAVALIAAARDRSIDGVITLDAAGSPGADLILQEQQRVLDGLKLPPADRQARIDLQKRIQAAVISGSGWQGVPDVMRRQADTPWFKSLLTYDPSQILPKVKQPILIIQGDLDPGVPSTEGDRLGELARARKKAPAPEVVHIPDVDHTFSPARAKVVSPKVAAAVAEWIKKL